MLTSTSLRPQRLSAPRPTHYAASHPPITLVGGFLGAGKTSTVRSMLLNRCKLRIAVLVNDLASVNVDAAHIRRSMQGEDGVAIVELDNGCICCGTGAKGLGSTIRGLGDGFDHIVVELSGVADPQNVRASLRSEGLASSRTVTLVDADAFPSNWASVDIIAERRELVAEAFESRAALPVTDPVVELMLRGIEAADVLVLKPWTEGSLRPMRVQIIRSVTNLTVLHQPVLVATVEIHAICPTPPARKVAERDPGGTTSLVCTPRHCWW